MEKIKKLFRIILYRSKANSKLYVRHLRKKGMTIGEETVIFEPRSTTIDETRPWMITIGDNVQITKGVTILTHGFDWSVLKNVYGEVLGSSGKINIGNNVFVGMNSTILKGVTIGDNCIIGANSLVNKDIPENSVVAGNPAKFIMSIDEYYKKRKAAQIEEACQLIREYKKANNENPTEKELSEFFFLFKNSSKDLEKEFEKMMELGTSYDLCQEKLNKNNPPFKSIDDLISYALGEQND